MTTVKDILAKYPCLVLQNDSSIWCPTNQIIQNNPEQLNAYVNGKNFQRYLALQAFDYHQFLPYIVPIEGDDQHMFCNLTQKRIHKKPDEIVKHSQSKAFLRLKNKEDDLFKSVMEAKKRKEHDSNDSNHHHHHHSSAIIDNRMDKEVPIDETSYSAPAEAATSVSFVRTEEDDEDTSGMQLFATIGAAMKGIRASGLSKIRPPASVRMGGSDNVQSLLAVGGGASNSISNKKQRIEPTSVKSQPAHKNTSQLLPPQAPPRPVLAQMTSNSHPLSFIPLEPTHTSFTSYQGVSMNGPATSQLAATTTLTLSMNQAMRLHFTRQRQMDDTEFEDTMDAWFGVESRISTENSARANNNSSNGVTVSLTVALPESRAANKGQNPQQTMSAPRPVLGDAALRMVRASLPTVNCEQHQHQQQHLQQHLQPPPHKDSGESVADTQSTSQFFSADIVEDSRNITEQLVSTAPTTTLADDTATEGATTDSAMAVETESSAVVDPYELVIAVIDRSPCGAAHRKGEIVKIDI